MNGFKPEEVVLVQGRPYPLVGGRLRLAHESNEKLAIKTELVHFVLGQEAVVRVEITTTKGTFTATGVATAARDARLIDALVELAETRALARGLRWAGYGYELGFEEVGEQEHSTAPRPTALVQPEQRQQQQPRGGTPASAAQLRCIRFLAKQRGQEPEELLSRVLPGANIETLSLAEASRVIDKVKSNGHGNGNGQRR